MNIVQIIGGLGNQMFQYAFYKALKSKSSDAVKLDIGEFNGYELHNGYELEHVFQLHDYDYASENEIKKYKDTARFFRYRKKLKLLKKTHYIEQNEFQFNNDHFDSTNTYFQGYWQSSNYFIDIEEEIRKEFQFKVKLNEKNQEVFKEIQKTNSCSVHVRRGDYLTHPYYRGICEKEYYENSISIINEKTENPSFFIFSNDIKWCQDNLKINNATFIDWNLGNDSYIDMFLMSQCKHNIIANSTFSWWGAWLNLNPQKIVIKPKKWINKTNVQELEISNSVSI